MKNSISMNPLGHWKNHVNTYLSLRSDHVTGEGDNFFEEDEIYLSIMDAKYEKKTPREIAQQQKHLSDYQKL